MVPTRKKPASPSGRSRRVTLHKAREHAREILARAGARWRSPCARRSSQRRQGRRGYTSACSPRASSQPSHGSGAASGGQATEALYRVAFNNYILPRFGKPTQHDQAAGGAALPRRCRPEGPTMAQPGARGVPALLHLGPVPRLRDDHSLRRHREAVPGAQGGPNLHQRRDPENVRGGPGDGARGPGASDLPHGDARATRLGPCAGARSIWRGGLWPSRRELAETGEVVQQAHDLPLEQGRLGDPRTPRTARAGRISEIGIEAADFVFPARRPAKGQWTSRTRPRTALKKLSGRRSRLPAPYSPHGDRWLKKDLGVAPWIVEAILGHAQERPTETYMPSFAAGLMRAALRRLEKATTCPPPSQGEKSRREGQHFPTPVSSASGAHGIRRNRQVP